MFFGTPFSPFDQSTFTPPTYVSNAMKMWQDAAQRQTSYMRNMPWPMELEWQEVTLHWPLAKPRPMDDTWTRDAFHALADSNLNWWEHAAESLKGMPGWAKWAHRAPSEFWSAWFDQWMKMADNFDMNGVAAVTVDGPATVQEQPCAKASGETNSGQLPLEAVEDLAKPSFLGKPKGKADDLTEIKGIGEKLSRVLNDLGVYHFWQIAEWTPENIAWVDEHLSFKGRIQREAWVEQAAYLKR